MISIADVIYLISKNVDLPCNPRETEASLFLPSVTKGQHYNKSIVYKFAGIAVSSLRVVSLPILQIIFLFLLFTRSAETLIVCCWFSSNCWSGSTSDTWVSSSGCGLTRLVDNITWSCKHQMVILNIERKSVQWTYINEQKLNQLIHADFTLKLLHDVALRQSLSRLCL